MCTAFTLDITQTDKRYFFQKTSTVATKVGSRHKIKFYFKKLPFKCTTYWHYKEIDHSVCLHKLDEEMIKGTFYNESDQYKSFFNLIKVVTDINAPKKLKKIGGNKAPFMTKETKKNYNG